MTFHTLSKNLNKIKRHFGRHILNDLNFNIKKKNLIATHPPIFQKMALIKSANDSLKEIFIQWVYWHTHFRHKHREICNHVLEGKKSCKGLKFNK